MFLKEEGKKKDKNGHDRWKLCDDIKFWMGVPNFTKKCSTERVFHIIGRENDSDAKHCFDNVFDWPTVVESIWSVRIWLMNSNSGLTSFPLTYNCVHVAASYHHTCEGGKLEPRGGKAKDWWAYEFLSYKQKVIWASELSGCVFRKFLAPFLPCNSWGSDNEPFPIAAKEKHGPFIISELCFETGCSKRRGLFWGHEKYICLIVWNTL